MSNGRILIVDDEPQIRRTMKETLAASGYEVDEARDGMEALDKLRSFRPDLIFLDINMPELSGIEVCRMIRRDSVVAIIMLTVRKSEEDKVAALDAGADDFITKPFSTPELLARVRAALRRVPVPSSTSPQLQYGALKIDFSTRTVKRGSASSHLTPKELDVLRYLVAHANQAVSHREILQSVWGPDYGDQVDYLRVVVKNLRKKIEANSEHPHFIKTEPWVGYRFDSTPESS